MRTPENTPSTTSIPDTAPTVSFDMSLGETYKNIEFDYEKFDTLAKNIEASDTVIKELSIVVRPIHNHIFGEYDPDNHIIDLYVDHFFVDEINGTLAHELRHARDGFEDDELGSDLRYIIGKLGSYGLTYSGIPLIAAGATFGVARYFIDNEHLMVGALASFGIAAGMKVMETYGYNFHPSEVRARKSEEKAENVLVFEDR